MKDVSNSSVAEVLVDVQNEAVQAAIDAGADPQTVNIIDKECMPVAYTAGRCRFYVKAAGEWFGKSEIKQICRSDLSSNKSSKAPIKATSPWKANAEAGSDHIVTASFIESYKPKIVEGAWHLSEVDLEWLSEGCYILGCERVPTLSYEVCINLMQVVEVALLFTPIFSAGSC